MSLYVLETKTSSEDIGLGSTFWKRTIMDVQVGVYVEGARSLGYDCVGVLYDVLRKPQQRPSEAKSEKPEDYEKRVLSVIVQSPEKFYQRGIVVRLEDERIEAAADIWQTATAIRDARRLKVFPRHPDSCVQWSRPCEYLGVCSGEASIDDPFLFRREEAEHAELENVNDEVARLTQSSIRCFRSCPRKYLYRYMLRARPLAKPETFRMGSSIHRAIEELRRTGGDIEAALLKLDSEDLFARAKERAMMLGYFSAWGKPEGIVAVEQQFEIDLVNPATGGASKTFRLAGRFDAIAEVDRAIVRKDSLEAKLQASIGGAS